jgi:hypothetical protein
MRMFTSTKVLLLFALLAANTGAARRASACLLDANCEKTCGASTETGGYTRSCSEGTCWVTHCFLESSLCNLPGTGNYNDCCNNTSSFFCEPY